MTKHVSHFTLAVAFGGVIAYGALNNVACSDDDTIDVETGIAGHGGGFGFGGYGGSSIAGSGGSSVAGSGGAASVSTYTVTLTAANEVPSNPSPATGTATVTLDLTTGGVTVNGTYSGLTAAATVAHIHGPATTTTTGPILIPLTVSGGTSGTVSGSGTLGTVERTALVNGKLYVNVHTSTYPDGEIRGQITP